MGSWISAARPLSPRLFSCGLKACQEVPVTPEQVRTINGVVPQVGQKQVSAASTLLRLVRPTGHGAITYSNGDTYTGDWAGGVQHGMGRYIFHNKDMYEGDWVHGAMEGQGTFTWADQRMYRGTMKANQRHGPGWMNLGQFRDAGTWESRMLEHRGISYEGNWANDMREGEGKQSIGTSIAYQGTWRQDKRQGKGTWTVNGAVHYEGDWRNDKPDGHGRSWSPDGSRYLGGWKEGLPCREGTFWFADGKRYEGQWWNGRPNGFGVMHDPYGAKYQGDWADGKPTDSGTFVSRDGSMYGGGWVDGKWVIAYGRTTQETEQANKAPSLKECLADVCLREFLVVYAERTYQTENLFYLLRIQALKASEIEPNSDAMRAASQDVVDDFVREDVPLQINIDSALRESTIAAALQGVDPNWFEKSYDEVYRIMEYDVWAKYLQSTEHAQMLAVPRGQPPGGEQFAAKRIRFSQFDF